MMEDLVRFLISEKIDESITNQQNWGQLPRDQKQILDEILEAIHDMVTSLNKVYSYEHEVLPQYKGQFQDAIVIKLATELGMINGGRRI